MNNDQSAAQPATATVKIHGNSRVVDISLDGVTVDEFANKFRGVFGIPDNATVLVNGSEADTVKPGDTVTFQTKASSKAS